MTRRNFWSLLLATLQQGNKKNFVVEYDLRFQDPGIYRVLFAF